MTPTPDPAATAVNWSLSFDADNLGWLTLDCAGSSANTLGCAVLDELATRLAAVRARAPRGLVIRSAKAGGFIAGADIREFTTLSSPADGEALVRRGQAVLAALEALPCPTVALIHGYALGGGLELALACRYRLAADEPTTTLGLPEVQLGIHPGFGGTVRAPRLIGARRALDLMLTGRSVGATQALSIGLVDGLVPAAGLEAAARDLLASPPRPRRAPWLDRLLTLGTLRVLLAARLRTALVERVRRDHYPAPYAIVDLWSRQGAAQGDAPYLAEARSIAALFTTPTARNLVRVYGLRERLKAAGRGASRISRVHVVGAGVMGGDIAAWSALRGFQVTLADRDPAAVGAALARARDGWNRVKDRARAAAAPQRLRADPDGSAIAEADLVVEAIVEDASAKQALYALLEPRLTPTAVLATNTSALRLSSLAATLARPARLGGLHFFNPVARMPLVEVVRDEGTDPDVVARLSAFARELDKLPLVCRSAPGFLVNRILFAYLREALTAVEEGLDPALIDATAVGFGMPQGPIELVDTVGLDVALAVARELAGPGAPPLGRLPEKVARGELGRKSGQGYYRWIDGKPQRPPVHPGGAPADLEDRLVLSLLNEAVATLREGIVEDADLVDAGVIFGTGFAPFRGGPLAYARARGVGAITARLGELAERHGPRFAPDAGWTRV